MLPPNFAQYTPSPQSSFNRQPSFPQSKNLQPNSIPDLVFSQSKLESLQPGFNATSPNLGLPQPTTLPPQLGFNHFQPPQSASQILPPTQNGNGFFSQPPTKNFFPNLNLPPKNFEQVQNASIPQTSQPLQSSQLSQFQNSQPLLPPYNLGDCPNNNLIMPNHQQFQPPLNQMPANNLLLNQPTFQPGPPVMGDANLTPNSNPPLHNNLINNFQNLNLQYNNNAPRYLDLTQERNLLTHSLVNHDIVLPTSVCNPEVHCSPDVFRCTMSAIPETYELLNKCRLPLGLTLQPFRDLKNLTVIQTIIVRCRYCRTYINPYVYLADNRHWKCNLCYRLNDLPEEFCWDPVSKTFGDPTRRPELQNATIEYIAPNEYMLRTPQPALYLFIFDVGANAVDCGYLHTFAEQLSECLDQLPGDDRTMIGFIGIDAALHFFQFNEIGVDPKHLIVYDIDDSFFPVNTGLFVELKAFKDTIFSFVQRIPTLFESNTSDQCCLGAALNIGRDLIIEVGGRISVFLANNVNIGPGVLDTQESLTKNAGKINLRPSSDFYKAIALECTGKQISIDLFVLGEKFVDLTTLAEVSKYCSGSLYHFPAYHMLRNQTEVTRFKKTLYRYLTRKIGFEAVLRIRCSKGLSLHTFYGNFFIRSTDLLAMANVNPDAALAVQVQIDENLGSQNSACFQAALLYTSSRGDRRIRVHTLCLPIENDFAKIFNHFDVKAVTSLLAKMAVERATSGVSLIDCREALINAATDSLIAYNRSVGIRPSAIFAPVEGHLKFIALFVLGLLKNRAFSGISQSTGNRPGYKISVDDRVSAMLLFKNAPLSKILLEVCPELYAVHNLDQIVGDPLRLPLSYEHINRDGVYLMDSGSYVYLYVCQSVQGHVLENLFGVSVFNNVDESSTLTALSNPLNERLHAFLKHLFINRGLFAPLIIIREDSSSRELFTNRLVEDRTESSHSYVEFLQHLKREMSTN